MNKGNAGRLSTSTGLKFEDTVINYQGAEFDADQQILNAVFASWEKCDAERLMDGPTFRVLEQAIADAEEENRDAEHYALEGGWRDDIPEDRVHPETVLERAHKGTEDVLEGIERLSGGRLSIEWINGRQTLRIIRKP